MATFSKADLETLSHDGFTNNGQQYFYVVAVTSPSLLAKLKSNENGHAWKAASDTISCFADTFLHFFKNANYFMFH